MTDKLISKALAFDPNNFNRRIEITQPINVIPNQFYLTQQLGLFNEVMLSQKIAMVPVYTDVINVLEDYNWGEKSQTLKPEDKQYLTIRVPHFPASYAITPQDVEGIAAWAQIYNGNDLETIEALRTRKLEKARKAHAWVQEIARMFLITTGSVYAPRGTVSQNFYQEFGVSRTQVQIDLVNSTTPDRDINTVVSALRDNLLNGSMPTGTVAFCDPLFFQALINNAYITDVLKAQLAGGVQNLLLARETGALGMRYRSFDFQGVTFYEVPPLGSAVAIPAGTAYFLPTGVEDLFTSYYATANKFATVNTMAQKSYAWERRHPDDEIIEIETETNVLNFVSRPQEIVVAYLPGSAPVQPYTA